MQPERRIRMTQQRQVILDELRKLDSHPTADEIYEIVRGRLPRISLGTVYRNLEFLSRCGIIRKLELSGSQMRFDGFTDRHNHIRCIRCGRVDDLPAEQLLTECDRDLLKETGYKVIERRIEFLGICPNCRDDEGTEPAG